MKAWKCAGRYREGHGDWVIESDDGSFSILTEQEYQKQYGGKNGTMATGSDTTTL
jgi:hypothetical protein